MVNRKYSKHFPKEYRERIDWAKDNYLLYARLDNGLVFERNETRFTNQYVVPHCPQLLLLFDCYINVKISAGLETVKYLCQGRNFREWRCKVIDKSTLWDGVIYYVGEEYYLVIV